jgi:hypothetical protein
MGRSLRPLSLGIFLLVACSEATPVIYDPDTGVLDAGVDDIPTVTEAAVDVVSADASVDAAVDVALDGGRACRTVDDCTAPDLCSNAQACRFGRCVVVGGPASCDDAVSCTDDSCDAAAGRCVHAANDMRCPADNFCAQESGCVRELPCEIGDTTCARLNGNPCTGTWSCEAARLRCVRSAAYSCDDMDTCTVDTCMVMGTAPMCAHRGPDYQTDIANCGTCGTRCVAGPNQAAACAMGACAYTCADGFADADGMPANGCECNRRTADAPDLMFQDTNCDGIDGDASVAVFVSPRGSDTNPGTREMPLQTIAAAINLARMGAPPRPVYVAQGTYRSSVELVGGVSLYGGYDDLSGWARSRDTSSVIQGDTTAVFANELARATELQLLTIQSASATTPGGSSYGVRVVNGSALLTLRGCTIAAGSGAAGPGGSSGATGANGSPGSGGGTPGGGGGGGSPCGATGGAGGGSGSGGTNGSGGALGAAAPGGASGGGGGAGATRGGTCVECIGSCSGAGAASPPAPGAAGSGNDGRNGNNGRSAPGIGMVDMSTGIYAAPSGVTGTDAAAGGGGGGGGAGTGGRTFNLFPPSCTNHNGGGGGGGGGGGCSGTPGSGGSGGGGSFAVMSASSNLRIEECRLTAGRGGNGGNGGSGGAGGAGGNGGAGGGFAGNAGGGGAGARGGTGGTAGSGSGGPGGPSVCVYYLGSSPSVSGLTCTRGGGGMGGEGGRTSTLGDAPDGASGPSDEVRAGL